MPLFKSSNFKTPNWGQEDRVHNWRNYISEDMQKIWDTFTDEQKEKIAENADNIADSEDWD